MLQHYLSYTYVGIYALASNFANIMKSIWIAFNNSFSPLYINYFKNNDVTNLILSSKRYLKVFSLLCFGFILLSPEVYYVFAPKEFYEGIYIIPLIVISNYFVFIYSYYGNIEFCYAKTKMLGIASVISCIFNIIFNYFLIQYYQVIGAAISTLLSSIILMLAHYYFARSICAANLFFKFSHFVNYLIFLVLISLMYYYLIDIFWIRFIIFAIIASYLLIHLLKTRYIF